MNKRDKNILEKICEEAAAVAKILDNVGETAFLANDEKMRAVCMTLINIGELIKNLDNDFRQIYSHIPWKEMAGLRDVTAHGYFTLRMPDIWIYASTELPIFTTQIKTIIENEQPKELNESK